MSNPAPHSNNVGFWLAASLIVVLTAGLAASCWPSIVAAAHAQSDRLVGAGKSAQRSEAQLDFDLATRLNPGNQAATLELARTQIAAGQSQQAAQTLERAGEGSNALRLRLRTQLELNQTDAATASAEKLTTNPTSATNDDLVLAGLANILAGNSDQNPPLIARMTSPEAVQRVTAAQSDKLTLARELYALELPESSKRLLMKLPSSFERDILLASLEFNQPTAENLASAETHATVAVNANPTDQPARRLLIQILQAEQKTTAAAKQQRLLDILKTGRP